MTAPSSCAPPVTTHERSEQQVADYYHCLITDTYIESLPEGGESLICTPFVYLNNEPVCVLVRELKGGCLVLTDNNDLFDMCGEGLSAHAYNRVLKSITDLLEGSGIVIHGRGSLWCTFMADDFAQRVHRFIQMLIRINVLLWGACVWGGGRHAS